MKIGVINVAEAHEKRVALTPDAVKKLRKLGFEVIVESGAGREAYYTDAAYEEAGAAIAATDADVLAQADIITVVHDLSPEQISQLTAGKLVVGMLDPYRNTNLDAYAQQGVSAFAMEMLPRTLSRAQNMDVLSSQANLAGYKAVLMAANEYARPFPMFMTSAGTVKPAKSLNESDAVPVNVGNYYSQPELIENSQSLMQTLKAKEPIDLQELMSISDDLAQLNAQS